DNICRSPSSRVCGGPQSKSAIQETAVGLMAGHRQEASRRGGMKKRHRFRIGVVLAAIVLTIALLRMGLPPDPISRRAYSRIEEGMSEEDVRGIFVLPPGNYATDFYTAVSNEEEGQRKYGKCLDWITDHAMIDVEFDDRGLLLCHPSTTAPPRR